MKTPEELKALKEEVETLNKKLAELSEEELQQVTGGGSEIYDENCTDFWRCGRWMNYLDNFNDDKCKCESFSSNDPICLGCSHAAASQK